MEASERGSVGSEDEEEEDQQAFGGKTGGRREVPPIAGSEFRG